MLRSYVVFVQNALKLNSITRVRILIKIWESGRNFFHFCFCSDNWASYVVECRTRNYTEYHAHCHISYWSPFIVRKSQCFIFSLFSHIFSSILFIFQLLSRYKAKRSCVRNFITIPSSRHVFVKHGCVQARQLPDFWSRSVLIINITESSELARNAEKLFVGERLLYRLLSGNFLCSKFLRTEIKHDEKTFALQRPKTHK